MTDLLGRSCATAPSATSLRRHLRRSLALGDDALADQMLDRSSGRRRGHCSPAWCRHCAAASSTNGWRAPAPDDSGCTHRTPLRDFVPGNLFDELLVPDVEFQVPWAPQRGAQSSNCRRCGRSASSSRATSPATSGSGRPTSGTGSRCPQQRRTAPAGSTSPRTAARRRRRGRRRTDGLVYCSYRRCTSSRYCRRLATHPRCGADWDFRATPLGPGRVDCDPGVRRDSRSEVTAHLHSPGRRSPCASLRLVRGAERCGSTGGRPREGCVSASGETVTERRRTRCRDSLRCDLPARVSMPRSTDGPSPDERTDMACAS